MTFQMALRYCTECERSVTWKRRTQWKTYVGLDVEVLEVERVLPDVDTNDGDVGEERVLVRRRRDLNDLRGGVPALYGQTG